MEKKDKKKFKKEPEFQVPEGVSKDLVFQQIWNSQLSLYHRPGIDELKKFKKDYGLTMVITIEGDQENPQQIQEICESEQIEWIHIPLSGATEQYLTNNKTQSLILQNMIRIYMKLSKKEASHKILLHCAAGLHRTGFCAYILLRACGNNEQQAMEKIKIMRAKTAEEVGEHRIKIMEKDIVPKILEKIQYENMNNQEEQKENENKQNEEQQQQQQQQQNQQQIQYVKFPRTRHLYFTGSESRDDLLVDDTADWYGPKSKEILVQEKIDGANLGLQFKENGQLIFRNRNQEVFQGFEHQWEDLNNWQRDNYEIIEQILEKNGDILFGEWCYQKHSVPYDKLPNFFVIFDYYEAKSGQFLSRKRLEQKVGKRFPIIRIITRKKIHQKRRIRCTTRKQITIQK